METKQTRREKPIQQKQKEGIATRVPDEVAYGIYEWFSSQ